MCEQLDPLYIKNLIFLGLKSFWWKDLINPKDRSRAPAHQGRDLQWWQGNQLSQNANTIILKVLTSQPESSSWIRLSNRKIIRDCFHCPCDLDKPDLFHLMQGKKQIQVFEHLGIKWRAIEPPSEFLWFPKPHGGKASELKIRNSILGHCLKTIVYNWSRGNFQQSSQPLVRICNIKPLSYSKNLGKIAWRQLSSSDLHPLEKSWLTSLGSPKRSLDTPQKSSLGTENLQAIPKSYFLTIAWVKSVVLRRTECSRNLCHNV